MRISDWSSDVCSSDLAHLNTPARILGEVMSVPDTVTATGRDDRDRVSTPGILGRLGSAMVARRRWVFGVWLIALVALGSAAPSVFSSLAGAGGPANGGSGEHNAGIQAPIRNAYCGLRLTKKKK